MKERNVVLSGLQWRYLSEKPCGLITKPATFQLAFHCCLLSTNNQIQPPSSLTNIWGLSSSQNPCSSRWQANPESTRYFLGSVHPERVGFAYNPTTTGPPKFCWKLRNFFGPNMRLNRKDVIWILTLFDVSVIYQNLFFRRNNFSTPLERGPLQLTLLICKFTSQSCFAMKILTSWVLTIMDPWVIL